MLHGKSIHYPSGYPMTRSPPFLVSNSPGPDPYRSNDNVYEELGPSHESDGESEPPIHSDDDFAEDELSLPGERSFLKPTDATTNATSTNLSDRPGGEINTTSNTNGPERQSVLSSASSTQDASTATAASTSSSHNINTNINNSDNVGSTTTSASRSGATAILSGMLRHTTGRKIAANGLRFKSERRKPSGDDGNTSTSTSTAEVNDLTPMQQLYDNTSSLMALSYHQNSQRLPSHFSHDQSYHHSLHHVHNLNNSRNPNSVPPPHFYNTIESEVERRNRINVELKNCSSPVVATIFREQIQYPGNARYLPHLYAVNGPNGHLSASMRSKTNPRSVDKRRSRVAAPVVPIEPTYGYAEPVYRQNYPYESYNTSNELQQRLQHSASIMPDYSSGSMSSYRQHHSHHHPASHAFQNSTSLYAHGDSSFGSDSGYSHHTPASSIGRHDYDVAMSIPPAPPAPTQKPPSRIANALSFSWNRKKSTNTNAMNMHPNINKTPAFSKPSTTGASSPNNNSGSSTITSTLENTSSSSSGAHQTQNNSEIIQA